MNKEDSTIHKMFNFATVFVENESGEKHEK